MHPLHLPSPLCVRACTRGKMPNMLCWKNFEHKIDSNITGKPMKCSNTTDPFQTEMVSSSQRADTLVPWQIERTFQKSFRLFTHLIRHRRHIWGGKYSHCDKVFQLQKHWKLWRHPSWYDSSLELRSLVANPCFKWPGVVEGHRNIWRANYGVYLHALVEVKQ